MALSPDQHVTVVVALVGGVVTLGGILAGAVLAPWVNGRIQHRQHLVARRVDAYADFLTVIWRYREEVMNLALNPVARPDDEEEAKERREHIEAVVARIHIVGSEKVYKLADDISTLATQLNAALIQAMFTYQPDRPDATGTRMRLGGMVDQMNGPIKAIEAAMRGDVQRKGIPS
jgi:hypothetical protein